MHEKKQINPKASEQAARNKKYTKPTLKELGALIISTLGSGTKHGDKGSRGKRD